MQESLAADPEPLAADPEPLAVDPEFPNEQIWIEAGTMRRGQPAPFHRSTTVTGPGTERPRFLIDWVDKHRETAWPADPAYPNGCQIDVALTAPRACRLELPCPATRCGLWVITCVECGYAISLATAGRADDPRSVRLPCRQ